MDIYDFDKTLVPFDSGSLFIGDRALHYPWVLVYLPVWLIACLLFALRVLSLQKFKNLCFGFLPMVPVQRAAKGFWEKHLHQVYPWFTQKKRPAVIISASPDFLLEELQRRLGLPYLLCTRHNLESPGGSRGRTAGVKKRYAAFIGRSPVCRWWMCTPILWATTNPFLAWQPAPVTM